MDVGAPLHLSDDKSRADVCGGGERTGSCTECARVRVERHQAGVVGGIGGVGDLQRADKGLGGVGGNGGETVEENPRRAALNEGPRLNHLEDREGRRYAKIIRTSKIKETRREEKIE